MVPLRLLIVDDERDICECLEQHFRSRGCEVSSVFSGEEALDRLAKDYVDVILLDVILPGISGLEVLRRIKELRPGVRVVMVTAHDHAEVREEAKHRGACGFVTKPFDLSDRTWSAVFAYHA